jgi:hypothetical protein
VQAKAFVNWFPGTKIACLRIHEVAPKKDVSDEHDDNWQDAAVGMCFPSSISWALISVLTLRQANCGAGCIPRPPLVRVCWQSKSRMRLKAPRSSISLHQTLHRRHLPKSWLRSITLIQRSETGGRGTALSGRQTRQRRFWAGSTRRSSSMHSCTETALMWIVSMESSNCLSRNVCTRKYSGLDSAYLDVSSS